MCSRCGACSGVQRIFICQPAFLCPFSAWRSPLNTQYKYGLCSYEKARDFRSLKENFYLGARAECKLPSRLPGVIGGRFPHPLFINRAALQNVQLGAAGVFPHLISRLLKTSLLSSRGFETSALPLGPASQSATPAGHQQASLLTALG